MFTWLQFGFFTISWAILLWHFLAESPEVFCVMGWVGGRRGSHPLTLLYEGSVRGKVVLAGREGGRWSGGEGRLGWVGGEPSCCLVLLRFQPEKSNKAKCYHLITTRCFKSLAKVLPERCNGGGHTGVARHWVLPVHGVVRGGVAGGAIRGSGGGQAGWDGGDAGHDRRRVHCGGRLQTAHVETHGRHATEETWVS